MEVSGSRVHYDVKLVKKSSSPHKKGLKRTKLNHRSLVWALMAQGWAGSKVTAPPWTSSRVDGRILITYNPLRIHTSRFLKKKKHANKRLLHSQRKLNERERGGDENEKHNGKLRKPVTRLAENTSKYGILRTKC